jgi:hypothetical protein
MTATAEEQAAAKVAAVRDDPARRLELAARFYDRRIGRVSIRSYRRAEMAFMRWQIRSRKHWEHRSVVSRYSRVCRDGDTR